MNNDNEQKEIEAIYPLTYLQEGMLYHCIFNSDPELYFEQTTCRLKGLLNIDAFKAAWQEVLRRHAILRTSFVWKNTEQMMQVVLKTVSLPFRLLDWAALSKDEQHNKLKNLLHEYKKHGFKLHSAPLLNVTVIKLSEWESQFIFNHHHLIIDAWSQSILLKELFQFYEGFCRSENIRLEAPRPFRDFVMWLRNKKDNKSEEYWRRYLKGFHHPASLPFEEQNPSGDGRYEHEFSFLSPEFTLRLNEFARSLGVTLSTVLQCAWALLLNRFNEDDDVVFGMTTAGRPPEFEKIESIIGLFINTIPVRIRFKTDETVRELLRRIQSEFLESREFEHSSLVHIHASSELPGDTPLFRSIFVFENVPQEKKFTEQIGSLKISDITTSSKTNFPLVLVALPGEKISVGFAYDTNLFTAEAIKTILGYMINILHSVLKNPEQKVSSLSILSEEEQKKIITGLNPGYHPGAEARLLHGMFERQVLLEPQNPALTFEKRTLSYIELNEEANRLANYLIQKGVHIEDFIGLYMDRSPEMIIGILGILKTGAAYVPLDPNYPVDRINYILHDAGVKFLVTKEELLNKLTSAPENVVCLDKDKSVISAFSRENPDTPASYENAAYVIYTSGSTGKPKGVVVTHFGTFNLLENMKHSWGINSNSRIMQFASIGFDASLPEIFLALTSGAQLFIAPQETLSSVEKITEFVSDNRISLVTLPPSLLSILPKESLPPEATVVSAGEACPWDIAEKFSNREKFFNAYGPTEVTVCCCWNEYNNPEAAGSASNSQSSTFPVGKPFPNVRIYILDRFMNPVPPGVMGEIFVSGPGLARGYLGRPDLTAEKFVPDPYSSQQGMRLYKTGDMGRYLPDGKIEFLGRNDSQVKIRGFRIELHEIEAALMSLDEIRNAVVLAKESRSGEKFLSAYLIYTGENHYTNSGIRALLSQKLPDYMLPSEYNFLDAFPLTANGKIDRQGLLKVSPENKTFEARKKPLNRLEELLRMIWAEVLDLPEVDAESNFFDLGGHSLKAARIISRIRKVIGTDISLRELFNNPTISLLAEAIEKNSDAAVKNHQETQIEKSKKRKTNIKKFELSFAQKRLWFLEEMAPGEVIFNLPLALRLEGEINIEAFKASLLEIVKRHESLRTVFISANGQPFQMVRDVEDIGLKYLDLSHMEKSLAELELQKIASTELNKRFMISEEFSFRFILVKIAGKENVLLTIMHHIITDGWSMTIFIQELIHFYKSFTGQNVLPLPELPLQYADYAEWQREWFTDEVARGQLEYWKNELEGIKPLLELPTDFPRAKVQSFNGAAEKFIINRRLEQKLRDFCMRESVTPYIALLSVFQILLARLCDSTDIVVGSPVANRTRHETEKLIGFFVNTVVMRAAFNGKTGFRDAVSNNRTKVLGAFAHQDLPFEQLVEKLQPGRSLSYAPVFQAAFVFQNFASSKYELPGLKAELLEIESARTEYDLTLTISEEYDGELTAYWEYNTGLFKKSTALRMIGYFNTLLENLLENPEKSIWDVPILSAVESYYMLKEWNSNKNSIPYDCCINHVFEKTASKHAEKIAVTYSDIVDSRITTAGITYKELNERANRLANYLRRKGLKIEDNVAISLPRSVSLVVAILAVLKAGGVFIPLDPTYPKERLAFMLEDSRTKYLITTEEIALEQYTAFKGTIIEPDREEALISSENTKNPGTKLFPDNLVYIIYTSGSTGRPKGAMLSHKGLCNLWIFQHVLGVNRYSRVLQFASSSFDASIWELVMALLSGARLDLIPQALVSSPEDIAKVIKTIGTTIVTLPPSIMARLPEKNEKGENLLSGIKTLITAGEKIPVELANYFSGRVRLINGYGPTETTVCSTLHHCNEKYNYIVPIGRPIYNCEVYVLDSHMNPVPVGVPGELYIGGVGLSRGYIFNPGLTAAKFVPNPFSSSKTGARLYKSGDLVKYNENGILEFIGRIDSQVKIHGLRIELGEIEAVMLEHPNILQAAVRLFENNSSEGQLAGYLVPRNKEAVPANELRKFLRRKLPEYMVPSIFIALPEFPLTKSRKIDYRALPSPDSANITCEDTYVGPQTETERKLAEIAVQLLNIDRIGIHDNFFERGGHSLLVTRFVSMIRDELNADIPLRAIFENPTISEISTLISQQNINEAHEKVQKTSRGEESILDLIREIENLPENNGEELLGERE